MSTENYYTLKVDIEDCTHSMSTEKYRWTSLHARDRDSKNRLEYNEFAYKKT